MTDTFQVYLDMDGVLSDFNKGITCPNTYPHLDRTRSRLYDMLPELDGMEQFAMKKWFKDNAIRRKTEQRVYDAYQVFNHYQSKFYYHVEEQGFFYNLDLFPGARELVDGIIELSHGKLPIVLTAPIQTPWCPKEKEAWIERYFPGKFSKFICQKNKFEYAAPNHVLVDDMTKNTIPWVENGGGLAVLYKGDVKDTHEKIRKFRDQLIK